MERNYSQTRIQTFTQIEETTITAFLFTIQRSPSCLLYRTKSRFQALDIFQHSTTLLSRTFVIFLIMSLYKNIATGPKIVNRVEENEKKNGNDDDDDDGNKYRIEKRESERIPRMRNSC